MHFLTKLLKKIFNRTTVCVIGILLQLTYLVVIFLSFGTQYTYSHCTFIIWTLTRATKWRGCSLSCHSRFSA